MNGRSLWTGHSAELLGMIGLGLLAVNACADKPSGSRPSLSFSSGQQPLVQAKPCEVRDDDGVSDYRYTYINQPGGAVKKILLLDEQPPAGDKVAIKYFIEYNEGLDKAREIPDMIVKVNSTEVRRRKVDNKDFSKGWHLVEFDGLTLKKGENAIVFELGSYDVKRGG